ncbi:right-handed parallel beta-helix repeat-containing protein [Aphanothece sacrum]|uniref:Parallel beta-helix repeat protein n=1 Tax=Aphanothece sacrum FPU1 TaxID=1920663 RepID=A0A401ICU9_APHSA|nr:right-handed parallel beta-helix repeat-containing protein [Aphanothece sacrum]GBF79082.1 parallel beta-helix repeat protein [Aphanothece sacrum FPU1]GBF85128.1 parallel beta-helix repeat protein [Aphanothece sacrum FPU3]
MRLIESEGRLIQNLIYFSTTTNLVSGLLLAIFPLTVLAEGDQTPLNSIPPLPTAAKTLQEAGWTNKAITPTRAQLSQTSTPETPQESSSPEAEPEIRYFTPRIGARFVSGPEVGYPSSVAGLEGFLPLIQTGEQNLTFLEGRFLISTNEESNLRGNFIIGHRFYTDQRIYGAYLGYDVRDTEFNQFNQLGFGLETLGDVWDAHFNVYVPLGNTQQQTGENVTTVNTITQSVTADFIHFQKNFLVFQDVRLQQQQQQQVTRSYENALFGLDFDLGAKILQIGNQGDLRGFVGGYYYEGQQITEDIWGWRLGLEVKPTDTLRLGISVQDDDTFGTNVIVRLGANFPGTRPRNTSVEEVWARMGEWVHRQEQIVVDEVQTTQTIVSPVEVLLDQPIVAINPTTNQPWIFRHVNLGQGGGDGTFENPFGTVDGAISIAQNNEIVYVQSGTNPGIPSFRVPDGVQVLSTGPQQVIPTANRGNVILPLSNAGILPTVNGTITMGNNSVLSGFDITGTNSGVRAIGVNNFVVRDNIIRGINGSAALLLTNANNGLITNNQIIGVGGPALVGTNINNIRFPNNTLTSFNSTSDGIRLDQINGSIDFTGITTTINNARNRGIAITNSNGTVTLSQVNITNTGDEGILIQNVAGGVNINGGTITGSKKSGIQSTNSNLTVNGVGIIGSGSNGIQISNNDNINHTVAINNTKISNVTGQGINITNSTLTAFANNQINNVAGNGINLIQVTFDANPNTSVLEAVAGGTTTVNQALGNGIKLTNVSGSLTPDTTWKISNITNNGSGNSGLFLNGHGNLTIGNIDINNVPNPDKSSTGITLIDLTGSFTVVGNTSIASVGTGLFVFNSNNDNNANYSFSNSNGKILTITNTSRDGMLINGGSNIFNFGDTNISNASGNGVTITGVNTGQTTFNSININGVINGISFITGNTHHLIINRGSIQNTITTNSSNGNGIDNGPAVINLTVSNVNFNNIARSAITNGQGFAPPALRTFTLNNNTFRANNTNVINLSGGNNTNLCLKFTGNTISSGTSNNNNGIIRFVKSGAAGTFRVENIAPIATFRSNNNNWTGTLTQNGTITNVPTGTCPTP